MADRGGWRKAAGAGCGCLLVLTIGVGALVALNWPKVTAVWSRGKAAMTEMLAVQSAVRVKYGVANVSVKAKTGTGIAGTMLRIELVNAPGVSDLSEEELRKKALEIAVTARDALRSPDSYPRFEIVFSRRAGVGVTVSTKQLFRFEASDLPPPPAR